VDFRFNLLEYNWEYRNMVGPRRRSFTFSIFSSMGVCIFQIIFFFFEVFIWISCQFLLFNYGYDCSSVFCFCFPARCSEVRARGMNISFAAIYSYTRLRQIVSRESEFNHIVAFNSNGEILCVCRLCNISYLTCQVLLSLPHMHFWFSSGLRFIIRQVLLFFCFSTIYFYE